MSASAISDRINANVVNINSRDLVRGAAGNELFFAVVGHVGSGTSEIAETLKTLLEDPELEGGHYETTILKARLEIIDWARAQRYEVPDTTKNTLAAVTRMQDLGDLMRRETGDHSAVARALVRRIRAIRGERTGIDSSVEGAVKPDGTRRAYILDSLRHPAEVELLRAIYQEAYVLIGVVCDESVRETRITNKYDDCGHGKALPFMKRDMKAPEKHGQKVGDTFHLSDFFVDNTASRFVGTKKISNPAWTVIEDLNRLVRLVSHSRVVRPTADETAMFHAYGAQMRSACLSRQVGAALIDADGNLVSTGTNEVPKAGGGVYGGGFASHRADHRCAFRGTASEPAHCSNTKEQNSIIDELVERFPELVAGKDPKDRAEIKERLRSTRIGGLIEFSRAVHAEMDALLSAARIGVSPVGCRLFVTTFPCHYCARHLVSAGIDEVQFIEPYLKSQALVLHEDAITVTPQNWDPPSKVTPKTDGSATESQVLFRPFTGVAPKLYRRAFFKDRDLKDDMTGLMKLGEPKWGSAWEIRSASYVELEARPGLELAK